MAIQSASVSIEYMIVSMIFAPLTILVLVHITCLIYNGILTNPDRLSRQDKNTATLLRIAICIWITIIIYQITQNLILNPFLIPKKSECTNGDCNYCEIFGRFEEFVLFSKRVFVLIFLIQTLKYAIHKSHSCISCFLIALQSWTFLCFIVFCLSLFYRPVTVKIVNDNTDYMICGSKQPDMSSPKGKWDKLLGIGILSVIITSFIASVLFAVVTWRHVKSKEFYKYSVKQKLEAMAKAMHVVIKHCILCIQLLVINGLLNFILWYTFMRDTRFSTNPIIELIDGMCIYMLFDFGSKQYYVLYGWIHFRILEYWKRRHQVAIEIIQIEQHQNERAIRLSLDKKRQRRLRKNGSFSSERFDPYLGSIDEDKSTTTHQDQASIERERSTNRASIELQVSP